MKAANSSPAQRILAEPISFDKTVWARSDNNRQPTHRLRAVALINPEDDLPALPLEGSHTLGLSAHHTATQSSNLLLAILASVGPGVLNHVFIHCCLVMMFGSSAVKVFATHSAAEAVRLVANLWACADLYNNSDDHVVMRHWISRNVLNADAESTWRAKIWQLCGAPIVKVHDGPFIIDYFPHQSAPCASKQPILLKMGSGSLTGYWFSNRGVDRIREAFTLVVWWMSHSSAHISSLATFACTTRYFHNLVHEMMPAFVVDGIYKYSVSRLIKEGGFRWYGCVGRMSERPRLHIVSFRLYNTDWRCRSVTTGGRGSDLYGLPSERYCYLSGLKALNLRRAIEHLRINSKDPLAWVRYCPRLSLEAQERVSFVVGVMESALLSVEPARCLILE